MQAVELLEEALNTLTYNFDVVSVSNGVFTVKDLMYTRIGSIIYADDVEHTVTEINRENKTFTISDSSVNIIPNITRLKPPFFAHGTATMQNNEWVNTQFDSDKFPAIYVREVLTENEYTERSGNALERESFVTLYILDSVNFEEWETQDHYNNIIPQLKWLKNKYTQAILNHKRTGKLENIESTIRVNLGVYTTERGNTSAIFNDRVSAIELGFTLPIYINFKTHCL